MLVKIRDFFYVIYIITIWIIFNKFYRQIGANIFKIVIFSKGNDFLLSEIEKLNERDTCELLPIFTELYTD